MSIRYQADNDLRNAIVQGVVRGMPEVDFRSARAARLDGVPDPEVLEMAARDGRVLISHDFRAMPGHFRQFAEKWRSPGVLLIEQDLPVGQAVESLLLIWEASEPGGWENRRCLIPNLVTIVMGQPK